MYVLAMKLLESLPREAWGLLRVVDMLVSLGPSVRCSVLSLLGIGKMDGA